jgi:hypothetical protein
MDNIQYVVQYGTQIQNSLVVGSYAGCDASIQNSIIVSGGVGIGTSIIPSGEQLIVNNGNISINVDSEETGFGIVFSDGTFQTTATITGPTGPQVTGPTGAASTVTGPSGVGPTGATGPTGSGGGGGGSGNYSNSNVTSYLSGPVIIGNLTIDNATPSTSTTVGALVVTGGIGVQDNVNVGGSVNLFSGRVGIGTSSALGIEYNGVAVYGVVQIVGTIFLSNLSIIPASITFADSTVQSSAGIQQIGNTVVNFGSNASTFASTFVSAPGITSSSIAMADILVAASSNNTLDQHYSELIQVTAGNIIAGSGFTIYAVPTGLGGLTGNYNVQYLWR